MGLEIFQINDGKKAAQRFISSDEAWTSVITVQGHQRLNIGILVGSQISDIISAAGFSDTISGINSFFTGIVTLQRRMPEEDESYHWRDVAEWSISSVAINKGGSENITAYPDPETAQYRLGLTAAAAAYVAGVAHIRLGTS